MRRILIIGGSKGIGKAILLSQLEQGNKVINLSRTEPEVDHPNLDHFSFDLMLDPFPLYGEIDSLVYCPGSINLKPISSLKVEDFRNDFEINVIGAVKAIQYYLNALKSSDSASVLLFSTVAAKIGMPFHASVAAAKSGLEGLVRSLAAEWATSIRINAIAPTLTNTDLAARFLRNEKMIESSKGRHPLNLILEPSDVAAMADYLLSPASRAVSGQVFELDGGITTLKV